MRPTTITALITLGLAASALTACDPAAPDMPTDPAAPDMPTDPAAPDMPTVCRAGCTTAADCVQGGGTLTAYDADNYACESGVCRYTGCRSDTECLAMPGSAQRCVASWGGVPVCQLGCAAPVDCVQGGGALPAYDADNYACESGACRYLGCRSDDECAAIPSRMGYVCRDPGTGTTVCVPGCASPTDCVSGSGLPAYDADNYACEAGACRYTGCRDDAECAGLGGGASYVCR